MVVKLGLGKVTRDVFERCVLPYVPLEGNLELDGSTVNLQGRTVIAHSPSIGVPPEPLGFFAFHYAACNVAVRFGKPKYISTGIYLPLNSTEEDLITIVMSLGVEAKKYGVKIVAGQTATYYGLEIPFVSTTCLGEVVRVSAKPVIGDKIFLVGKVGGEAVWLKRLSEGSYTDSWRNFTSYPAILGLQNIEGVKMMHDVSEGGVKGALVEVLRDINMGLSFSSGNLHYAENVIELEQDVLRAPTYGALIVVASHDATEGIFDTCSKLGYPCSELGALLKRTGLRVNGDLVESNARGNIDELYGAFKNRT
jgi:hydrogenase maturation factor